MSSLPQIVFNYPSSEDSQSPPEKRAKQECWESRLKKLKTGELSDFKIVVGDRTILTHKFVLTDFPYFKTKFDNQSNFKSGERDHINIPNYEYAIVYEMVKYMYSFKVNISTENVQDLLKISDEYQVVRLFEKAQKFIVDRIETENVIDCLILTEHITTAKLLKSASIDYILDHYSELESEKKLSWDLLKEILKKYHVKILNESVKNSMNQV